MSDAAKAIPARPATEEAAQSAPIVVDGFKTRTKVSSTRDSSFNMIKFNSSLLFEDIEAARKRKKLSLHRASIRMNVASSTLIRMGSGEIKDITVTSLARILDFLGTTDISKYIYDDGEY